MVDALSEGSRSAQRVIPGRAAVERGDEVRCFDGVAIGEARLAGPIEDVRGRQGDAAFLESYRSRSDGGVVGRVQHRCRDGDVGRLESRILGRSYGGGGGGIAAGGDVQAPAAGDAAGPAESAGAGDGIKGPGAVWSVAAERSVEIL